MSINILKKIAIRVDASLDIGVGHIMRCLTLANELANKDTEIIFITRPTYDDFSLGIENKFQVKLLPSLSCTFDPDDYDTWLQVSEKQDATDFIFALNELNIDVDQVIVDHYGIGLDWEKIVKRELGCQLVAIDDLMRVHAADVIIDQTLGCKPQDYTSSNKGTFLTGSEYALLRPQFNELRENYKRKQNFSNGVHLLVSMGGGDQHGITLDILNVLLQGSTNFKISKIDVVLNEQSSNYSEVKELSIIHSDIVVLHSFLSDMAKLMAQVDIAIGAPGSTSWERCCLGLPSILIPLADNQKHVAHSLTTARAVVLVLMDAITTELMDKIELILKEYDLYQQNCYKVCDGLGAGRVAQYLKPTFDKKGNQIVIRLAKKQDIRFVYNLQIIKETREYALTKDVPTWPEHQEWMNNKLVEKDCFFYIIQQNNKDVGVVRLDKRDQREYEISIFLSPDVYGHGVAKAGIQIASVLHINITILARVLEQNKASQYLFKSLGFKKINSTTYRLERLT